MDEPHGQPWGFFYAQMEVVCVGYRKVGYMEQLWYVLRYKLRQFFRKEVTDAKET